MSKLSTALILVAVLGAPSFAAAQAAGTNRQLYVIAAVSVASVSKGKLPPYKGSGLLGGWTPSVIGIVGVKRAAVSFETGATVTGTIQEAQSAGCAGGTCSFTTHHRDILFLAGVRVQPANDKKVSLEGHGGLAFGVGRVQYTDAQLTSIGRAPEPASRAPEWRRYAGLSGGVDVLGRAHPRVRVGVTTHFFWLSGRSSTSGVPSTGLGATIFSVGATVRIDFRN